MTQAIEGFKVIVIPTGQNADSGYQVSIMLFPELSGGPTGDLADFPDLVNWPETLQSGNYGFVLTLTPPAKSGATISPVTVYLKLSETGTLNADLWSTLFSGSTPYTQRTAPSSASDASSSSAPDYAATPPLDAPIVSYPVLAVTDFVSGQYENLPLDRKPTYADLEPVYGDIATGLVGRAGSETVARQAAERQSRTVTGKAALVNDFADVSPAEALAAQQYFLTPPLSVPRRTAPTGTFTQFAPNPVEFHAALTFIGHHYELQRQLGLVFDFTFPGSGDSYHSNAGDGWLLSAVLVEFEEGNSHIDFSAQSPDSQHPVSAVVVSPQTVATVSGSAFYADDAPSSPFSIINGGQVPVQPGGSGGVFGTHTISAELAGMNAATFAQKLSTWVAPVGADDSVGNVLTPPEEAILPPTFDAKGISLALVANAQAYLQAFERQGLLYEYYDPTGQLYQNYAYPLYASDLQRGLTMDVLDTGVGPAPGTWYSLHDRNVTYSPKTSGAFTPFDVYDVAGVQNQPALGLDAAGSPQWYVTETLMVFNGWSNALPFPGVPVQDADAALDQDGPFSNVIQVDVTPAPILNGSTNPSVVLPRLRFGRTYEIGVRSVDLANNVLPLSIHEKFSGYTTDPVTFGREDVVASPDVYPQNGSRSYPITGEGLLKLVIRDLDGSGARSVRAIAPPRVTPGFAITHGMLDTDGGALPTDSASAKRVFDTVGALDGGQYVAASPANATSASSTVIPSVPVNQTVPYIPDPLARGGALRVDPGYVVSDPANNGLNATTPLYFPFQSSASQDTVTEIASYPVMLELVPGPAGAKRSVNFANGTVTVALQPGDVTILDLSCTFDQDDLAAAPTGYGLGSAVQQAAGFDPKGAANGGCWAITPDLQVQLVYARQFPSLAPNFTQLTPTRNVGDTFVTLSGAMNWSPNTTSKIDFIASWTTPVDNGPGTGAPDPSPAPTENVPVLTAPAPKQVPPVPDSTSADPGDVTELTVTDPTTSPASPAITGFASAGHELTDVTDSFAGGRHEFRDTKYRKVAYGAYATSRFSEYFPEILAQNDPSQFQNPDPEAGQQIYTFQIDVPSSARPAAVSISSVVPIYGWAGPNTKGTTQITSAREPSALRIYLDRPWWSSGDGELLGVLTWPGAESGPPVTVPSPVNQYVSDWGLDPVFGSAANLPSAHPQLASFTNATTEARGLGLEELAGTTVNVAGHPVLYDSVSDRWFADVAVDFGRAYNPMVRLAVARYQPNSIAGVEIGRVSVVDVHALEQGRSVQVTRNAASTQLTVLLSGVSYTRAANRDVIVPIGANPYTVSPGQALVQLQHSDASIADSELTWQPAAEYIVMTSKIDSTGTATWTATVPVPAVGKSYRLSLLQYEMLPTKDVAGDDELAPRLLFQDHIPLAFGTGHAS